jgi:phosphatidylglycerol:prolipoprotein diacylglycerol transferase
MNALIRFPNLGIEVAPGKSISIFGFSIAYYGIAIALGMLCGALIAYREAKKTGQSVDDYIDFTTYTLIAAIIGARIYYVAFQWEYYRANPLQIFNLRAGGLAIYGGIIASAITLVVFTRVKHKSFWLMADTACQGLVVGQIIGRWGNFFNREAFGGYTNNLFAMQIPLSEAHGVTQDLIDHVVQVYGMDYIQVHPTFLYEGAWNLLLFILLNLYKRHKKFDGEIFALYLVGYGVGRAMIETLRTDQLLLGNTVIPVSQLLSVILVLASLVFIAVKRASVKKAK